MTCGPFVSARNTVCGERAHRSFMDEDPQTTKNQSTMQKIDKMRYNEQRLATSTMHKR